MKLNKIELFGLWILSKASGIPLLSGGHEDLTGKFISFDGLVAQLETAKKQYEEYLKKDDSRHQKWNAALEAWKQKMKSVNRSHSMDDLIQMMEEYKPKKVKEW